MSSYYFYVISIPIVRLRLKSVTNIQKITKSMKMVSAAKYAKAERELKPARAYGQGSAGKNTIRNNTEILFLKISLLQT